MEGTFKMLDGPMQMACRFQSQFMRASRRLGIVFGALLILGFFIHPARGQNYLTSTGMPSFAAPQPVEFGSVDASTGNLHLSIPLGSYSQRGSSQPEQISLEYNSNIWEVSNNGMTAFWAPYNGPAWYDRGGWYISNMVQTDPSTWTASSSSCESDLNYLDQSGTLHYFHVNTSYAHGGCPSVGNNFATDSSGYSMYVDYNSLTGIYKVYAPDGTLAYVTDDAPQDTQGHYIRTEDSNGNYLSQATEPFALFDPSGRQIAALSSGTYPTYPQLLTLPTSQGAAQYQFIYTSIIVSTNFQQSNVQDVSHNMISVIRSVTLPDAAQSTYYFTYDCDQTTGNSACSSPGGQSAYYGEITGITLPTGGTVSYAYQTFSDAYGNKSRWVSSHSSAGGNWSYSPQVLFSCEPNQYWPANSCMQQTTVTSPTGQIFYHFVLNNGAWPATIVRRDLQGVPQSTVTNTWDFSQPCELMGCTGSAFVTLQSQQTTVPSASGNLTKQTQYTYECPGCGSRTAIKEWEYIPEGNSFSPVPDRATYTWYLSIATNNINRPAVVTVCNNLGSGSACWGGGFLVSQTLYTYDCYSGPGCSALTPITGVAQHDDANFGAGNTARGNPTSISRWVSGSTYLTTSYTYDTTGQVLSATDPAGNLTTYNYADKFFTDSGNDTAPASYTPSQPTNAYLTSVTDPIGTYTEGYYFGSGTEAITWDYNNQPVSSHYQDGLDRKTEEIAPIGWSLANYSSATQSDMYTAVGDTSPSTGCVSCQHSQTNLDSWGRTASQILVNNPIGPVEVDSSYDTNGRLYTQSHPYSGSGDPNHVLETIGYDALDRQISTMHPDGQSQQVFSGPNVVNVGGLTSQQGVASTYGYGYPQVSEDESGYMRQQWLDGFGRIIEVDEPNSSGALTPNPYMTNYLYDAGNRLTQVIQGGQTRTFAYDGLGRKISENTPEGGTVTFSYNTSGGGLCSGDPSNVCTRTDARGVVSTYTYDHGNRLTGVAYTIPGGQNIASMPNVCTTAPNGTSANVCYYYDQGGAAANAIGQLTEMVDPTGSESYSRDANGRTTQLSKVINGQTYNIGYQYDAGGDLTQITYPSGRVVQQAYNQVGQLCQIAPSAANCTPGSSYYAANFSYNSPGKLTGFNYGNGLTGTFYYSPDRTQLTYMSYAKGNSTYFNLQYSYQQNSMYSPPCSHGTAGNNGSIQCITDNVDSGRSVGYGYDPLQRMTTAKTCGSSAFPQWGLMESYDRFGNRWSQTATAGSLPQPSLTFGFNGMDSSTTNQPLGYAYDPSGNMTVEPLGPNAMTYDGENRMTAYSGIAGYTYDANGLRVAKSVSGGTTTVSIFSGSSVLAEYDNGAAPGSPSREYVYNGAGDTTGLLAMISGGTTTYYHKDHLSVRLTTDASGNVASQQGTLPFGEQWYQAGSGNKLVFTSYDRDSESGLDYALARYYNSTTGAFLMADPVAGKPGDPQSWNRYAYASDNPIMITDPSGKSWLSWLITAGAITADIVTAGAATGFTMASLEGVGEGIGEGLAVGVASNAIQTGHLGINEGDLEGAAIGDALSSAEGLMNLKIMPQKWLEAAPIHYAEHAFNSLVENEALNGKASVDWIGAGISTGIDMLNDRATGKCGRNSHGIQNVDGHQETTTSISPPAGYSPFNAFGIIPNGNRNNSLFMQTHYNGGEEHVDIFNPNWGGAGAAWENGAGAVLHGIVDYSIGKLFFRNSPALDPGCIF